MLLSLNLILGELYYLRMMLSNVKGPTSYAHLRTVGTVRYDTFREACFALGLLSDDKEYIGAIKEAHNWGTGFFLRKLFVMMLLTGTTNRPDHVWKMTWQWLSDGILYQQRQLANNRGISILHDGFLHTKLIRLNFIMTIFCIANE